jgi:aspartyl-tRNA(Asn)/glutamyl-tRNA(Gln) amidotransferase subunit A
MEYCKILNERIRLINQYGQEESGHVMLMPTSPVVAPKLADLLDDDDHYFATNALVLRNPSVANVLDGCSISLPYKHESLSVGIMLTAPTHHDDALLALAQQIETTLA